MSRSRIFARLLWKDAWVLWPLTLALCGIAVMLYLLVPLLPGNESAAYSAWLLLFPNLFALGAPQLQIGQEEETRTFTWARSLPIPWRTAVASNILTSTIGLATVWAVCGFATYVAYLSGGFHPGSSFASVGTWPAELYRVMTFSWMLLGLGYLCSWYFRSPLVALIAVVPTAFLSVGLTHLVSGWIEEFLLTGSSASEFRLEIYLIGHTNLLLAMVYGLIAAYLARGRWTHPESERGFWRRSSASPAYRPAPLLITSKPAPAIALLWQSARQSSVAILAVAGVILLCLIAAVIIRQFSTTDDYMNMVIGVVLLSVAVLGTVAFGGDHARDRHRFLAEIGLSRWQVWWTRLLIPLLASLAAMLVLWATYSLVINEPAWKEVRLVAIIGMAVFGLSQLTGMWIRRPAVAVGSAMMLFIVAMFLGTIYEFYENFVWTGWLAIFALFLASLSMCRRWMDRDRSPVYHAGIVGWLGVAAVAVFLPIIAVRWWTTPPAMPEWRERTSALAARVAEPHRGNPIISYVNVRHDLQHLGRENLKQLQEAFADAADDDSSFPLNYELASTVDHLLHIVRSRHVSAEGRIGLPFSRYPSELEAIRGSEKWYANLLSFSLDSVEHLPELRYELRDADQADQYEQIAVAELERPESRELLGEDRWREFVGRLRTAEQREEDRRNAMLASYRRFAQQSRDSRNPILMGGYSPWTARLYLPWERARSRRWIDLATRISLEQLAAGVPEQGSAAEAERLQAWREALDESLETYRHPLPTRHWTRDFDRRVETLRKKVSDTFLEE